MRKPVIIFLLFLSLFLFLHRPVASVVNTPTSTTTIPSPPKPHDANRLWSLVENWRTDQGFQPYIKDQRLCSYADLRVSQITSAFNHDLFYQEAPNLHYGFISENLAEGYDSEEEVLSAWLNSPVHLADLKKEYIYSCISCVGRYCAEEFSSFSSVAPIQD